MNKEITCQSCHHILESPVTLTCCYSPICLNCFQSILYQHDNEVQRQIYNCPFCKKVCEDKETILHNSFLEQFIKYYIHDKVHEVACDRCEKLTRFEHIILCNDCNNKKLCEDCSDSIHNLGNYRNHERTSFSKGITHQTKFITNLSVCTTHIKEKIEFVCPKDSIFLCNLCLSSHKQTCRTTPISVK